MATRRKRTITLNIEITPATEFQEETVRSMLEVTLRATTLSVTSWHKGNKVEGSVTQKLV